MSNSTKVKVPRTMRLWQVYYTLAVVGNLTILLFITTARFQFTFADYMITLNVVLSGVLLWLMWSRKSVTRFVVPISAIVILVFGSVGDFIANDFIWDINYLSDSGRLINLVAGLYFFTSRKVRAVLIEDFSTTPSAELGTETGLFRPKELLFWRNILLYFMVFAIVGHWLELGFNTFLRYFANQYDPNSAIWSDYLFPYNVYGVGAIACVLLLYPIKDIISKKIKNILVVFIISFILNAAVCTLIELVMGLTMNMPDANGVMPLWDYSDLPLNFMGQICMQNALAFGVAATFMVWVAFPTLERLIGMISKDMMNVITIAIIVFYLILSALYFFDFPLPSLAE